MAASLSRKKSPPHNRDLLQTALAKAAAIPRGYLRAWTLGTRCHEIPMLLHRFSFNHPQSSLRYSFGNVMFPQAQGVLTPGGVYPFGIELAKVKPFPEVAAQGVTFPRGACEKPFTPVDSKIYFGFVRCHYHLLPFRLSVSFLLLYQIDFSKIRSCCGFGVGHSKMFSDFKFKNN